MISSMLVDSPKKSRGRTTASGDSDARTQLTPTDWIAAATEVLVHKSIDSVRVDVLAKELHVTRGSFYWHFEDREDLLRRVLMGWQEAQTEQIIARHQREGVKAEALIVELVELPFHGRAAMKGSSVELAIRAWARRDDAARMVVDEVDSKRLAYIEECFTSLGFSSKAARARAFTLYCYMQSESLFRNQGSATDKAERRQFVARMLLAEDPTS